MTMSQPNSGLFPALIGYYQRLQDDPDRAIAGFGFSVEKIHFQVVLNSDGTLYSFDDIRDRNDKGKPIPRSLVVPDGGGRSGTGMKPFFCWDNTGYTLGRDNKGKSERAAEMFAAFRELHKSFLPELESNDEFVALYRFLDAWDPARAETLENWEEAAGMNVVFKLRGRTNYVHQGEEVKEAWLRSQSSDTPDVERALGISLLSGEEEELARLHPQIRGVVGANTTGAAIVSFNLAAFESYGKSQSFNAPVGTRDAFRYTTALNRLLADESRRVRIGDATVVFWTDRAEAGDVEPYFHEIFGEGPSQNAEHAATVDRLRGFLAAARQGRLGDMIRDPEAPFYVLGLSPNASRLNVRYWLAGTVKEFADRIARHIADLEMTGEPPGSPPLVIRRILLETSRDPKDIAPNLAGEVARAVLSGSRYPQVLFNSVVRRIRADTGMNHRRAAILKAHLIRNLNQEVPVALNKEHPDEAYHLGRLFAALEYAQTSALGNINRTVKDAFFGAAAATPSFVFPRLIRLNHHHLEKLPTAPVDARGAGTRTKGFFDRLIQEICARVTHFPGHLTLERQGLFYIGYFHQRQEFFTKRTDINTDTSEDSNNE